MSARKVAVRGMFQTHQSRRSPARSRTPAGAACPQNRGEPCRAGDRQADAARPPAADSAGDQPDAAAAPRRCLSRRRQQNRPQHRACDRLKTISLSSYHSSPPSSCVFTKTPAARLSKDVRGPKAATPGAKTKTASIITFLPPASSKRGFCRCPDQSNRVAGAQRPSRPHPAAQTGGRGCPNSNRRWRISLSHRRGELTWRHCHVRTPPVLQGKT